MRFVRSLQWLSLCAFTQLFLGATSAQSVYTPYPFTNFVGSPTVAGTADGSGTNAQFNTPHSITIDNNGNLFVADTFNHAIRKITPAGVMTTIAGSPSNKGYADGVGFAEASRFSSPIGIGADANGNLFVADNGNQVIRKVAPDGSVTLFAGKIGLKGSANGARTDASFNSPNAAVVDPSGNIFISDGVNRVIRKITGAGVVSTFAGTVGQQGTNDGVGAIARFQQPSALAVDGTGNLYVADQGAHTIRKITPDGLVSTVAGKGKTSGSTDGTSGAALFSGPQGLAVDAAGVIYVADSGNHTIRKVASDGTVTTLAGIAGQSGSADGTNTVARFSTPRGIAVDPAGPIYVGDSANSTIRRIVIQGTNAVVTTLAGSPGQNGSVDAAGSGARFHFIYGITCDSTGNIFAVDRSNDSIRKITPAGVVSTLAGVSGTDGSADGAGAAALFYGPEEITVDPAGTIFVVEHFNNTVRQIAPRGTGWIVTTLAGCPSCPAGTNDGPGLAARFDGPFGLTRDSAGNLYVADTGNKTIRKLTPANGAWTVSTFAGRPGNGAFTDGTGTGALFSAPLSLGTDSSDNLFVCDGERIRKISPAGVVSTIAGGITLGSRDGPGSSALFGLARGIAIDSQGIAYLADSSNHLIRRLAPSAGDYSVTTIAGNPGFSGTNDGVGADARFNQPTGIALDSQGNLYVVDSISQRITKGYSPPAVPGVNFDAGSLSLSGNSLGLRAVTPAAGIAVLERSTALPIWTPIQTNQLSGSSSQFSLPFGGSGSAFFRLKVIP